MKPQTRDWPLCDTQGNMGQSFERICAVAAETPGRRSKGPGALFLTPFCFMGLQTSYGLKRGRFWPGEASWPRTPWRSLGCCPEDSQQSMQRQQDWTSISSRFIPGPTVKKGSKGILLKEEEVQCVMVPWIKDDQKVPVYLGTSRVTC